MQETITSGLRPKSSFQPSTPYLIQTGDDGTEALHSNESGSPRFFRLRSSPIGILTILEGCLEFASVTESEFERGMFFVLDPVMACASHYIPVTCHGGA